MAISRSDGDRSDLLIVWPKSAERLSALDRTHKCASARRPKHAKPGAVVLLVDSNGHVLRRFKLARIDSNVSVTAPNGKLYPKGHQLIAKRGSVHPANATDSTLYKPKVAAIGAISYFDAKSKQLVWYGGEASKTSAAPQSDSRRRLLHLAPLHLDTTGRTLTQPEAELIERYVAWLGGTDDRFLGGKLDRENLYIDLFVRGPNLLIEAKSHADRDSVRMAVGQLRDYRHFLERRCKMAVLLPQKPNPSVLRYLERERIACIWETPTRRFGDSVAGKGSSVLRR